MGNSKLNIGLKQSRILCGMQYNKRVKFIGEGLPIVLESACGFWKASQQLVDLDREATVLRDHAVEEAGKLLILLDIARCPKKAIATRIGIIAGWLSDHLARMIYAKATSWSAMCVGDLRGYVDNERNAHYLDGEYGEYIAPNSELFGRESRLYADIELYEDGVPHWNRPTGVSTLFPTYTPAAISLIEAFAALGLLSVKGVQTIAQIWNTNDFTDLHTAADSGQLVIATIDAARTKGLASEIADQHHVDTIIHHWQMPMYNLDFNLKGIPRDELEREREFLFSSEKAGW